MSADTRQQRLDGALVDSEAGHSSQGYPIIFEAADPATDFERVARWALRAEAEGVI